MVLWSLPLVSEMAGGEFYLKTQQLLDLFYPTLFAITVAIPLAHLVPRYWDWILAVLAITAGAFNHLENSAVAVMLRVEPDALTETMVSTASNWALAKSISTTIALVALLVVLCIKGIASLKPRKAQTG